MPGATSSVLAPSSLALVTTSKAPVPSSVRNAPIGERGVREVCGHLQGRERARAVCASDARAYVAGRGVGRVGGCHSDSRWVLA